MKRFTIIMFAVVAIGFSSCKKATTTVISDPYFLDLSKLPATFQQNVLFETYTATWCGYCPREPIELDPFLEQYPGRVFIAAMHQSDEMSNSESESLATTFGVSGIPDAHVNRSSSSSFGSSMLDAPANLGLAIVSSLSGNNAKIVVCAGFKSDFTTPLALTVYVTEDGLSYPQHNYYNADPTSYPTLYGAGDIISPYTHNHVFRKVVSNSITGDLIPSSQTSTGKVYTATYNVDLTGFNTKNMHVVAMINKQGGVNNMNDGFFNVQSVKLGSSIGWK